MSIALLVLVPVASATLYNDMHNYNFTPNQTGMFVNTAHDYTAWSAYISSTLATTNNQAGDAFEFHLDFVNHNRDGYRVIWSSMDVDGETYATLVVSLSGGNTQDTLATVMSFASSVTLTNTRQFYRRYH
jgi:hypothetical protein